MTLIKIAEKKILKSFNDLDYDMSPTPEQLVEIYSNGFQGVIPDQPAYYSLRTSIQRFYDAFPQAVGLGKGKVSLPFKAALALEPEFGRWESQTTGDCFTETCLVRMADGTEKKISDIKVDDKIITSFGNIEKVKRLICKDYTGEILKIKVEGYTETIECTPDHQFINYCNIRPEYKCSRERYIYRTEETEWKSAINFTTKDHLLIPRFDGNNKVVFDLSKILDEKDYSNIDNNSIKSKNSPYNQTRFIKLDSEIGWLIGIYLAEGGCNENRITFNLNINETIYAETIKEIFSRRFGVDRSIIYSMPSKPNVLFVRLNNKLITKFFKSIIPGNIYTKRVPKEILNSEKSVRLACLRGWMDGDGCLDNNMRGKGIKGQNLYRCKLTGVSVCKGLVYDMFYLANSLGLRATITKRKPRKQSKEAFDLHMYGEQAICVYPEIRQEIETKVKIVKRDYRITRYGLAAKIQKIEKCDVENIKVYCIEVEKDASFIANGFAVHNCVSHSTRNAGMIDYCIDSMFGETEYKGRFATENIYGARGHRGQGANCSTLARYVSQEGVGGFLVRKKYVSKDGKNSVDLSVYRSSIGANWGPMTPTWVNEIAAENKALRVFAIKTMNEYRDAIAAGFGISMCSGYGFSSQRNEDGLSEQRGSWSHAMAHIGCDDTDWAHQKYGGMLGLIQNSWGVFNSGPKRNDQPDGSFWVRPQIVQKLINAGGCFCISSIRGYNRELVYDSMSKINELSKD